MFTTTLLKEVYKTLSQTAASTERTWTDGPLNHLAEVIARLPGARVLHVVHGSLSADGVKSSPRLVLALEDPNLALLIGGSLQRPGTMARTHLEWIVRPIGDDEHPWVECIENFDYPSRWQELLWFVHPLHEPSAKRAWRSWLRSAHADFSNEVFSAFLKLMIESELVDREAWPL